MGTLQYKSPELIHRVVTLEQQSYEVRVTFPPPPSWIAWLNIIGSALFAGFGLLVICLTLMLAARQGVPFTAYRSWFLWICSSPAICLVITFYNVVHFRRLGRTPSILRLTANELVWSRPGIWWLDEQKHAVAEVKPFEVLPVRDLFGRRNYFKLRCQLERDHPITHRFSTHEPELPKHIEAAFRDVLTAACRARAIPPSGRPAS